MSLPRVLLVGYTVHPDQGSEPAHGWGWAQALAKRGHTVELLAVPYSGNKEALERHIAAMGAVGERIHVHFVPSPEPRPYRMFPSHLQYLSVEHSRYTRWQYAALAYARAKLDGAVDIVHHVSFSSLQGGCALVDWGLPTIFGPVGGAQVAPWKMRRYFGSGWPMEVVRTLVWARLLGYSPLALRTVRRSSVVVVENSDTFRAASRRGAQRLAVNVGAAVPSVFLTDLGPGGHTTRGESLIWVGKLEPRKAPEIAIRAMVRVRELRPAAKLTIAGEGPMRESLERLVVGLGLADCVRLIGRIPRPDLLHLLDTSDVMLFTSLRDTFGAQNPEAWARGVPTVYLDHHGVHDHSPEGGSIGIALDHADRVPQLVGEAAARILNDPPLRKRMSEAARKHAESFTWDAFAESAQAWYADALDAGQSSERAVARLRRYLASRT